MCLSLMLLFKLDRRKKVGNTFLPSSTTHRESISVLSFEISIHTPAWTIHNVALLFSYLPSALL